MSLLKTPVFTTLYRHFIVSTSRSRAAVYEQELNQEPYPEFSQIQSKVYEVAVKNGEEGNAIFGQFCQEAEKLYEGTKCSEAK